MQSLPRQERFDRMISRWVFCAALPFLAAGGCSNAVIIHSNVANAIDVQSQLGYAMDGRHLRTSIQGNPFDMPKDSFDGIVTNLMSGANPGPPATFSTNPATRTHYHVVVWFNPSAAQDSSELCGGKAWSGDDSSTGKLRVMAAFCYGDQVVSEVQGEVPSVTGPGDPRFKSVIQQVTLFLFPPDEPQGDDRGTFMSSLRSDFDANIRSTFLGFK